MQAVMYREIYCLKVQDCSALVVELSYNFELDIHQAESPDDSLTITARRYYFRLNKSTPISFFIHNTTSNLGLILNRKLTEFTRRSRIWVEFKFDALMIDDESYTNGISLVCACHD